MDLDVQVYITVVLRTFILTQTLMNAHSILMAVIKYVLTLMGHFFAPVTLDIDLTLITKHVMVIELLLMTDTLLYL